MDEQIDLQQTVSGISGGGDVSLYQYFTASPLFAGFNDFNGVDRKLFLSEYITMSVSLKDYLASTETAVTLATIGSDYQLEPNQISGVATLVRELIVGKIFIQNFPTIISSKLGIDDMKAGEIANKIISASFGPILEDIKRIQRSKFPDKISQIQKEARPSGIGSPKPSASQEIKNMPLNRPGVSEARPQGMAQPSSTNKIMPEQSGRPLPARQDVAPQPAPLQTPSQPQQVRPIQQLPPKPAEIKQPPAAAQTQPQTTTMPDIKPQPINPQPQTRPQFKVPDLRSFDTTQNTKPINETKKSFEQELEKIANVIDLRASKDN